MTIGSSVNIRGNCLRNTIKAIIVMRLIAKAMWQEATEMRRILRRLALPKAWLIRMVVAEEMPT